jgi:hypothetical protein
MLPFNRDRVYQHALVGGATEDSIESKAIKRIFKALKDDALFKQLSLPKGYLAGRHDPRRHHRV